MNIESMDKGAGAESNEDFHSLNVKQMLFIDEFLFLLGSDSTDQDYLIQTKGMEVKNSFRVHHEAFVLKKADLGADKLLMTLGFDDISDDSQDPSQIISSSSTKRRVLKIWDYQTLIFGDYDDYLNSGFGPQPKGRTTPKEIPIEETKEEEMVLPVADISPCGVYTATVKSSSEIVIFSCYPHFSGGNDRDIKARTQKFKLKSGSRIQDIFFFRDSEVNETYLYVIATDSVYLMSMKMRDQSPMQISIDGSTITPNCADCNQETGNLIVSQISEAVGSGEFIYSKNDEPTISYQYLSKDKIFTKLYGKLQIVCSVEKGKDGQQTHHIEVYDSQTLIQYTSQSFEKIHALTVDNSAIFLFVTPLSKNRGAMPQGERRDLLKLTEVTVAEKLKFLLQKNQFQKAEMIAKGCSKEIGATVAKEQADYEYNRGDYAAAMKEYMKTIDYEAPSYVIEKYLDVNNLDLLITYLEKLINTPSKSSHLFGSSKDYTALLLNCYIKEQSQEKIEEQMRSDKCSDRIFEVETAIEICRQKPDFAQLALDLALRYQKWELLVSMHIEREEVSKALSIIEDHIKNVRDKVKLLQQYWTQLVS